MRRERKAYQRDYAKKYRAKHKDKLKAVYRKGNLKKYGISIERYNELVEVQKGRCKICGLEKILCVDHSHKTGMVRGLLCVSCNSGIGFLKDNIEFLKKAILYLAYEV